MPAELRVLQARLVEAMGDMMHQEAKLAETTDLLVHAQRELARRDLLIADLQAQAAGHLSRVEELEAECAALRPLASDCDALRSMCEAAKARALAPQTATKTAEDAVQGQEGAARQEGREGPANG